MPFDFPKDVLARSHQVPVLVDFWAPWCGPCRVLGPILDKVAADNGGAWELCKVNTDEHPSISQEYGIRGIPAVKLFVDGRVADEFTGALPETQVRAWLRKALPSRVALEVQQSEEAIVAGQGGAATIKELEGVLTDEPGHSRARIRLAQLLALSDLTRALTLLKGTDPEADLLQVVEAIRALDRFQPGNPLPDGPGQGPFGRACAAFAHGDADGAAKSIIELLQADRYYHDDAGRKFGVAIFTILGPGHPVTKAHRRTFDMWLY